MAASPVVVTPIRKANEPKDHAKSFYGALLGWVCDADASGLTTIVNGGNRIGAMREQAERQGASADYAQSRV